jgi:hypothetical protein
MVHKSVDPTVAYNVDIFVTNNILQVSFLRYELHCVIKCGYYNIKLIIVLDFHILWKDRGEVIYTVLDRPLRRQEVEAPRRASQSAHQRGKVVSTAHRPPLFQVLISVRGGDEPRAIVRPED